MSQENEIDKELYSFEEFNEVIRDPYATDIGAVALNFEPENCRQRFYKAMVLEGQCFFDEAEKEYTSVLEEAEDQCNEEIKFMAGYRLHKLPKKKD